MDNLNNHDDLDPDFSPDPDMLGNTPAPNTGLNPDTTKTVIATPVVSPEPSKKKDEVKDKVSFNELISSEVLLLENSQAKVVQLKDIHNTITGKDSVNRLDAESISIATEDFLSSRLSINEFTTTNSKVHLNTAKSFLANKISTEEANIKDLKTKIATESVMQYAASIGLLKGAEQVEVNKNTPKALKGAFVLTKDSLSDILSMDEEQFFTAIGEDDSSKIKDILESIYEDHYKGITLNYIFARVTMASEVGDSITYAISEKAKFVHLQVVIDYLVNSYQSDMKTLSDVYDSNKKVTDNMVTLLNEIATKETYEYVSGIKDILYTFKRTEVVEELLMKLPAMAGIVNKFVEAMKY